MGEQRQHVLGVGRALHQHDIGRQRFQRGAQAAGAAGAMVANAEDVMAWQSQSTSLAGAIEVFPAVALLDHRLQVFQPDHAVLHGVFDDRAGQAGGEIVGAQGAVAVVGGHGQAAVDHRDGLGGRERAAGRLELGLAVGGDAVAQFAEDGDDAADLLQRGLLGGQLQGAAQAGDALSTIRTSSSMVSGTGSTPC